MPDLDHDKFPEVVIDDHWQGFEEEDDRDKDRAEEEEEARIMKQSALDAFNAMLQTAHDTTLAAARAKEAKLNHPRQYKMTWSKRTEFHYKQKKQDMKKKGFQSVKHFFGGNDTDSESDLDLDVGSSTPSQDAPILQPLSPLSFTSPHPAKNIPGLGHPESNDIPLQSESCDCGTCPETKKHGEASQDCEANVKRLMGGMDTNSRR